MVYNGSYLRVYVDGELKGTKYVGSGTISSYGTSVNIGKHGNVSSEKFHGLMDEVKIHGQALGAGEFNLLPVGGAATAGMSVEEPVHYLAMPNPLRDLSTTFLVEGLKAIFMSVEVYDLAGKRVFVSGWQPGSEIDWQLRSDAGDLLANGIYLYTILVKDKKGQALHSDVGKLAILR